jgi:hypothetical protein
MKKIIIAAVYAQHPPERTTAMTGLNIFQSAKPSRQWGKIEPMSKEDARFWELRRMSRPNYERKRNER